MFYPPELLLSRSTLSNQNQIVQVSASGFWIDGQYGPSEGMAGFWELSLDRNGNRRRGPSRANVAVGSQIGSTNRPRKSMPPPPQDMPRAAICACAGSGKDRWLRNHRRNFERAPQ